MICEIISGIWSGNADDIYDKDFYNDNLISIVLNCSTDSCTYQMNNFGQRRSFGKMKNSKTI